MAYQRRSSRGNPWHDERGRFCSGPPTDVEIVGDYDGGIVIGGYGTQELCENLGIMPSMRDESGYYDEEPDNGIYDERSPGGVFPEVEIQLNDDNSGEVFVDYHGRTYSETFFNGDGEELRRRLNPTYSEKTPEEYEARTQARMQSKRKCERCGMVFIGVGNCPKCGWPEEKRKSSDGKHFVGEKVMVGQSGDADSEGTVEGFYTSRHGEEMAEIKYGSGKKEMKPIAALNSTSNNEDEPTIPIVDTSTGETVGEAKIGQGTLKAMPWDTDKRFKGQKNAKLLWLMAHPEHKYNDSELLFKIKAIQEASDRGAGKVTRERMFARMLKEHELSREEGIELLGEEFMK